MLLIVSCGTKKSVTDENRQFNLSDLQNMAYDKRTTTITFDSIQRLFRREILQTVTYLSAPDSAGNQYAERTEENRIVETFHENEYKSTEVKDSTTVDAQRDVQIAYQEDRTETVEKDKRFFPPWVWHTLGVVLILGVVYLLYRLFIRKR